ncbi:hypothetical protein TVAG_412260 [Trichomonas vaginalis G3]|uniref:Uncharacterized protein n=1 Tax=Trichomonas vaginalis (strain ATCC PRA-98 / G3) TaxID=412133 RepID=A2F1N2_TRIV3|nr:regulation of choline O-acetyltransferase protein [Trichomonas vaginalis G3]EAY01197.1 hypothetical protein TVAG_412260 [Trichomonas vaginalis G3]KAI5513189.1 regulation of choline O-acetyltransferase protein [Trichomonas vaginalis G3]|eukprot:XP_001314033.1 hypothetical protein [Trichomonas vaginalis G3]
MIFNPRYVPSYQGEDQLVKSNFYAEVKQQVLHSLGISSVLFEKYHQQNTNLRHSEYKCLLTKNGKKHAYLITPNAHKYAKEVLQLGDTISGDSSSCKSGIEFELNKAGDSLGSYLIGDTFNNEIMASYITASSQLTKATLSVLDDTGNYKITYDGAPEKPTKNPSYPTNPTRERPESSSGNQPISESTPTPKPVNPVEPTGGNVNHDKPQKNMSARVVAIMRNTKRES